MHLPRYTLRTFLVCVALVALYFPCAQCYRVWLSANYGQHYVDTILYSKIYDGELVQNVGKHFDEVRLVTHEHTQDTKVITNIWSNRGWRIEKEDKFYFMSTTKGYGCYFQFRDDRLINHLNTDYKDFEANAAQNGYSLPHRSLRFGVWPFYLSLSAIALLANQQLSQWLRSRRATSSST